VIVGVARTGSTLLVQLLNAQPRVIAFGEIFRGDGAIGWDTPPFLSLQSPRLQRMQEAQPIEFLEDVIFRRWPWEIGAVGFKLFYHHARSGRQAALWDHLRLNKDIALIHIKRRNILAQYLSLRLAHATNVWSTATQLNQTTDPLRLDPGECLRHFETIRAQENACDDFFAGRRILELAYETLVSDRALAMRSVADHLGVQLDPVEARVIRQRTQPLSEAIKNYDELREFFCDSPWEHFFRQAGTLKAGQRAA
jgi:LPS sulfotransferase NodH